MKLRTLVHVLTLTAAALVFAASCVPATSFGPVDNRPGLPVPDSYSSDVDLVSDELVVASVVPDTFNPVVTAAFNSSGASIYAGAGVRAEMMTGGAYTANPLVNGVPGVTLTEEDGPHLAFVRYWQRVGAAEYFPGGVTISRERSVTRGASQTSTDTFSQSISIEAEASAGGLFAEVTVTASASFTATQEFTSTTSTESTVTETFIASPPPTVSFIFTVWQLIEEYRFVDSEGALYTHPRYEFAESSLRFRFPTDEVIPVTFTYANR